MIWFGKEGSSYQVHIDSVKLHVRGCYKDMSGVDACSEKWKPGVRKASKHSDVSRRYFANILSRLKLCSTTVKKKCPSVTIKSSKKKSFSKFSGGIMQYEHKINTLQFANHS